VNYEAHVTFPATQASAVRKLGERHGWKFSQMAGDPVFGEGTYCYLTCHEPDIKVMLLRLDAVVQWALDADMTPLRKKVEADVYDVRYV
jgi:hypothetical protein